MSYSAEDAFAVNQALWRTDGENTAWMKLPAGWTPLTQVSPGNSGTALDVTVHVCEPVLPHDYEPGQMLICYPNPATTAVICKGLSPVPKDYQLHLIDAQGRRQSLSLQIVDDNIVLDIAHLTSGLYMVVLTTAHQTYISRLIKN